MYKSLIFLAFFLLATPVFAANRFVVTAGGSFSSTATWSTTSGGSGGASVPVFTDAAIADANSGQLTLDTSESVASITFTGYTNTFTQNANTTLNVFGNALFVSGMTYTPDPTAVIQFSASGTLTTGGKLMANIKNGTGTTTLGDNISFTAVKSDTLVIGGTGVNMSTFSIAGNSTVNRVMISSATPGVTGSLTTTGANFSNADFQDITFSDASSLNLAAITGLSGDAGGNTLTGGGSTLTFTTAATQFWFKGTGNWSTPGQWFLATNGGGGSGRVPLPQDNVVFDVHSFDALGETVTEDMPRAGHDNTWTGAINSPTISDFLTTCQYGSLTLVSDLIPSVGSSWNFCGRANASLTSAGNYIGLSNGVIMPGFTLTLQDTYSSPWTLGVSYGTLNTNGQTVFVGNMNMNFNALTSGTRTLTLGASVINLMATGTVWSASNTTSLTFNAGTSQINIVNTGSSTKTFAGGGLTYNNVTVGPSSIGSVIFSGSNTFNNLTGVGPLPLVFTSGTTQTVSSFADNGSPGATVSISSTTPGSAATISDSSGTNFIIYGSMQDMAFTGGASWYGLNLNNISDNSGITFNTFNNFCYTITSGIPYQINLIGDSITARGAWVDEFIIGDQTNTGSSILSYSYVGSNGASAGNYKYTTASGYSGYDSTGILPNIGSIISSWTTSGSRIAFMQIGTNDAGHSVPIATFISDMQTMIGDIYTSDPTTKLLVALPLPLENSGNVGPTNPTYSYDAALLTALKTLQASHPTLVTIDLYDSIQVGDASWFTDRMMTDGIHPNYAGYTVIADQYNSCLQSPSNLYCNIASFPSSTGN